MLYTSWPIPASGLQVRHELLRAPLMCAKSRSARNSHFVDSTFDSENRSHANTAPLCRMGMQLSLLRTCHYLRYWPEKPHSHVRRCRQTSSGMLALLGVRASGFSTFPLVPTLRAQWVNARFRPASFSKCLGPGCKAPATHPALGERTLTSLLSLIS